MLTTELAGTERHVAELACALRDRGWRTLIAVPRTVSRDLKSTYSAVAEVCELQPGPPFTFLPQLARLVRREHIAVINGHLGNGSFAALAAARLARVAAVSTVHFLQPRHLQVSTSRIQRPIYRTMLRRMDTIIAVSDVVRRWVLAASGPGGPPVRVVHNGIGCIGTTSVPGQLDKQLPDRSPGESVVLYAGRLTAEKQPALLIEAMAGVAAPSRLWIAGRGPEEHYLRRLAAQLTPGRVDFLGFVSDIGTVMEQADVLAVPSRAEGFGLAALDAMRAGKPVVGFASGALPEIVIDSDTGLLVPLGDVPSLAGAITRLVRDANFASRLGVSGRQRFLERFSAAHMAERTELVYAEAVSRRNRRA